MRLRQTAFRDPAASFHLDAQLSPDEAAPPGTEYLMLHQPEEEPGRNILPTRQRARLSLRKGANYRNENFALHRI